MEILNAIIGDDIFNVIKKWLDNDEWYYLNCPFFWKYIECPIIFSLANNKQDLLTMYKKKNPNIHID